MNREQASTPAADREMPVQSTRETAERQPEQIDIDQRTGQGGTQREAGQSIGRRAEQNAPLYGYIGGMGNPFLAARRMMEDMDRLMSNFGFGGGLLAPLFGQDPFSIGRGGQQAIGSGSLQTLWNPQVEAFQRGDQLVIRADLPGIKKEDVDIEIDRNVLTIRGERKQESEEENEGMYRSERSYGTFQRSIQLPDGITAESAQASFNDGVLEITLPVPRAREGSRRVQIR
jgi:HSP20 family protein